MRVSKGSKTAATNEKPPRGKLLSALTKLVQDELLPNFPETRSLKDSSNQDDNDVKLPPMRMGKGPRTSAANEKPASGKLLSTSTKLTLGIGQGVRAKKVLTLKTGPQKTDCS